MSDIRVLVTGGSGFIGTHFINFLLEKNIRVLNVDIQPPKVISHNDYWKKCDIKNSDWLWNMFSTFDSRKYSL